MPYLTCESCGLTSFAVRTRLAPAECPGCGTPLRGTGQARAADRPHQPDIKSVLAVAREMLAMDVAMVCEISNGSEIARHVVGDWPPLGSLAGRSVPAADTFCARMLDGSLSNYVCDARTDERVRDLSMVSSLGIGSWMGVPVDAATQARLYVLCCLSREARPSLGERDVYALRAVAQSLAGQLH